MAWFNEVPGDVPHQPGIRRQCHIAPLTQLRHRLPKVGSRSMKANRRLRARSTKARDRSDTFIVPIT